MFILALFSDVVKNALGSWGRGSRGVEAEELDRVSREECGRVMLQPAPLLTPTP